MTSTPSPRPARDVVARMGWADVDLLPVVEEGLYERRPSGCAQVLGQTRGLGFSGSTLVLEFCPRFEPELFTVEADGARATSFNVAPVENSELLEVTFKVNTEEIELHGHAERHDSKSKFLQYGVGR